MPAAAAEVHGTVAAGFEPVREAFEENFRRRREVGASLCVYRRGEVVVDLWGGVAERNGRRWEADTRAIVWSCTKGLVSLAFLMLEARGQLALDAPIASWWPEFAQAGKQAVTLRQVLNHVSGLIAIEDPGLRLEDLADLDRVEQAVLAQAPVWEPGTRQGYCAISWGVLTGVLFRRLTGETVGTFLTREVFTPLELELSLGQALPPCQVARLYPFGRRAIVARAMVAFVWGDQPEHAIMRRIGLAPGSASSRSLLSRPRMGSQGLGRLNDAALHGIELPWAGALASARGLARFYAPLAADGSFAGTRLVPAAALEPLHARQTWRERDAVLHKPIGWSQGFCKEPLNLFSPHVEAFGHSGIGGSLGLADPTQELAIGYVMNRLDYRVRSPRAVSLCHAIYRCLGTPMEHNPLLDQGA